MDGSDMELLRRYAASGDRTAVDELFARHYPAVHRVVQKLVRDAFEAHDVTQAAFLAAVRASWTAPPTRSVRSWLLAIAINEARQSARRARQHRTEWLADACVADRSGGPPDAAARREFERELDEALRQLPPRLREPLVLHYYEALPYGAVADVLDLPKSTVQARIEQAVARLRRVFRRRGHAALLPFLDLPGVATPDPLGLSLLTMNGKQAVVALLGLVTLGLGGAAIWRSRAAAVVPATAFTAVVASPTPAAGRGPLAPDADAAPAQQRSEAEAPAAMVFGRVVDAANGAPIPAAAVRLYEVAAGSASVTETDADGGYAFEDTRGSDGIFHLAIEKPGAGRFAAADVRAATTPRRDVLVSGLGIRGCVVQGPDASPVSLYRIGAVRLPFQSDAEWDPVAALHRQALPETIRVDRWCEVASPSGEFVLPDLQPGLHALLVAVPGHSPLLHNGGRSAYERFAGIEAEPLATAQPCEIVLPPTGSVVIEAVDRDSGLPLRSARAWACLRVDRESYAFDIGELDHTAPHRRVVPVALTQPGRIDSLEVRVTAPGYAPGHIVASGQANGEVFAVALGRPATVHGSVYGADGAPLAGAVVLVERGGDEGLCGSACADAAGRYEIGDLDAPSATTLRCLSAGLGSVLATVPLVLRDGEDHRIDLGRGGAGRVEGSVRIEGSPRYGANIHLRGEVTDRLVWCTTRADGAFAFAALAPDRYRLFCCLLDGGRALQIERFVDVGAEPVRCDLDLGARITGTVRVVGDDPAGGEPFDGEVVARRVGDGDVQVRCGVGDDGRFELRVAEPGLHEVTCDGGEGWDTVAVRTVDVRAGIPAPAVEVEVARDPGDATIELRLLDAASRSPAVGVVNHRFRNTVGVSSFEDGVAIEHAAGLGVHHFTVSTDEHRPASFTVEMTPWQKHVRREVALQPAHGVVITEVTAAGAGHRAGLRVGDHVRRHGDRAIRSVAELRAAVAAATGVTTIVVARDGVELALTAEPGLLGITATNLP